MYHFHIADDHPLFRSALVETIQKHFQNASISESFDLESTLTALEENSDIDLLLLDLQMPGSQDLFGLITVREKFPSIPVTVVSASESENMVNRALAYGASGYIPKSSPANALREAIKTLTEGHRWVPSHITIKPSTITDEERTMTSKIATLTPQQYRVLCFLREGCLNKQIAYELGVTEATVKAHITVVFRKLGINNRTQAVFALSNIALEKDE